MNEVTRLLDEIRQGDPHAAKHLFPLVYDELRRLASEKMICERPEQTLDATALVHEAWLRLVGAKPELTFENRRHFFGAAAEAMRRILVDRARQRNAQKRGGNRKRICLNQLSLAAETTPEEFLALHEALDRLAAKDPRKAELVKLRFFTGLTIEQASEALGVVHVNGRQ